MLPNACPKPRPHVLTKRDVLREREAIQRAVTVAINERDGYACRCCGRQKGRGVTLHRHHLVYRSKGGANSTENELLLCAICHALVHAKQLWLLGKNADRYVAFDLHEAAVVDVFGTNELPKHVRIVTAARSTASTSARR